MFVSKHHYAIELAAMGNHVYFLNPPEQQKKSVTQNIQLEAIQTYPSLHVIHHTLWFPYNIKFHLIPVFHLLMKGHIKKILKSISKPVDIVWSFDLGHLYPFKFFPDSCKKIFHPVDEPVNETAIAAARGAGIIFSVTQEILEKYKGYKIPMHFINHGLSDEFLKAPVNDVKNYEGISIGISGNLLRPDIDRPTLLQIIDENPQVVFNFWGSYAIADANISGATDAQTMDFIAQLKDSNNVSLHGALGTADLAKKFQQVDIFLICYDVKLDQSKGTNYHKVIEYLSTGKTIVSNNITTYKNRNDLVTMVNERDNNNALPALFKKVARQLTVYNDTLLQKKRIAFAKDNSYINQIGRIKKIFDAS